jgi:hypothetical protein
LRYGEEVKRIFEQIATASDFSFEAMEVDRDHIPLFDQKRAEDLTSFHCSEAETRVHLSALAKL